MVIHRSTRLGWPALFVAAALALGTGCGARGQSAQAAGGAPTGALGAQGAAAPSVPAPGKASPQLTTATPSAAQTQFTEDDLKTFAFASTDSATLAGELAAMTATAEQLSTDVVAKDLDAAEADAAKLLGQAGQMEADAGKALDRVEPLQPSDKTLIAARKDAVSAFGLTETYARTATDLANAALSLNLQELASVARQAASLQGTSDDLTSAYAALTQELESWAATNPQAAARALARYAA